MAATSTGSIPAGVPLFRSLLSEDEVKLLLGLGRTVSTELPARLGTVLPSVGAPTRLYESILKDEVLWLRHPDVRRWVGTTAKVGVAYASALKVEKDRVFGMVERGTSDAWDALLSLSDYALLAVGASSVLFGYAFLAPEAVAGSDLATLASRAGRGVGERVKEESAALGGALELLRKVPNVPTNGATARGLLDLALLVGITEAFAAKAQDALSDAAVLHHDGRPHNPGLQFDRFRRAIPGLSRLVDLFSLAREGERPLWQRYDLPGSQLIMAS